MNKYIDTLKKYSKFIKQEYNEISNEPSKLELEEFANDIDANYQEIGILKRPVINCQYYGTEIVIKIKKGRDNSFLSKRKYRSALLMTAKLPNRNDLHFYITSCPIYLKFYYIIPINFRKITNHLFLYNKSPFLNEKWKLERMGLIGENISEYEKNDSKKIEYFSKLAGFKVDTFKFWNLDKIIINDKNFDSKLILLGNNSKKILHLLKQNNILSFLSTQYSEWAIRSNFVLQLTSSNMLQLESYMPFSIKEIDRWVCLFKKLIKNSSL